MEARLVGAFRGHGGIHLDGLAIATSERSFGAALTGEVERGTITTPVRVGLRGAAGQSLGAFLGRGLEIRLTGVANDYVAKGLSGGIVVVAPEPASHRRSGGDQQAGAVGAGAVGPWAVGRETIRRGGTRSTWPINTAPTLAGNTCLYGATAGRLHVVGRAGMRFAVRNAGADAVVEGIGPHGAEYMTGGTLLILGTVGANFGAGMTGGRAYVLDPAGTIRERIDPTSVAAHRVISLRDSSHALDIGRLLRLHRDAGSVVAAELLADEAQALRSFWVVLPIDQPVQADQPAPPATIRVDTASQPIRPAIVMAVPS